MKHYEKLVEIGCFSRSSLGKALNCCDATAATLIQNYLKKGYIERVRHDLYVVISLETNQPILSRYKIGNCLFNDACISHHSAFEVFGYANQVFYETYVSTKSRFSDFEYNSIFYHRTAPKADIDCTDVGGVLVTSLEQTVIDSIHDIEKIGGLEETLRCILLIPALNHKKLLNILSKYHNGFLYQKCGYILESLNHTLHLPNSFFEECCRLIPDAKRYLTKDHTNYVWHKKWKLYAPQNLESIIDKGVDKYASI